MVLKSPRPFVNVCKRKLLIIIVFIDFTVYCNSAHVLIARVGWDRVDTIPKLGPQVDHVH